MALGASTCAALRVSELTVDKYAENPGYVATSGPPPPPLLLPGVNTSNMTGPVEPTVVPVLTVPDSVATSGYDTDGPSYARHTPPLGGITKPRSDRETGRLEPEATSTAHVVLTLPGATRLR